MGIATIVILVGILVLILFLVMYLMSQPSKVLAANVSLASDPITVLGASIANQTSVNYTYSFWVNIAAWNTNAQKPLITYTDNLDNQLFQIYLDPTDAGLYCSIMNLNKTVQTVQITNNLPLQRWCYVVVSAQNMNVDCYLNGVMTNAIILRAPQLQVANSGSGKITIGNNENVQGSLKQVARVPEETNPYAVWQYYVLNYLSMQSSSPTNQSLQVALMNNGQVQGNLTVF